MIHASCIIMIMAVKVLAALTGPCHSVIADSSADHHVPFMFRIRGGRILRFPAQPATGGAVDTILPSFILRAALSSFRAKGQASANEPHHSL
jgi:hypothetical protein